MEGNHPSAVHTSSHPMVSQVSQRMKLCPSSCPHLANSWRNKNMSPSCSQFLVLDMRQQWQNRCVGNLPAESSHDKSRRPLFLGGTNGSQNPDCNYSKIIIYIYKYIIACSYSIIHYDPQISTNHHTFPANQCYTTKVCFKLSSSHLARYMQAYHCLSSTMQEITGELV